MPPTTEPRTFDGRSVHAAWRDGMLAQGREVAPDRLSWDALSEADRLLDDGIADRLRAEVLEDVAERVRGLRLNASDPGLYGLALDKTAAFNRGIDAVLDLLATD